MKSKDLVKTPAQSSLLALAFFEGAAVMTAELSSAKILAPVFGTSLIVWAAVLGITLLALTAGYFAGGRVSKRSDINLLFITLGIAALFLILMPYIGAYITQKTLDSDIRSGSVSSLLVFLFPALFLMGMSSPQIIALLPGSHDKPGDSSGKVYAISTLGGIVSTFLCGFYLLPEFGIKMAALLTGLPLLVCSIILLLKQRKTAALLLLVPFFFIIPGFNGKLDITPQIRTVFHSEGILGQLRVVDQNYYLPDKGWVPGRGLLINNTSQTVMNLNDPSYDLWPYSYLFAHIASILPPKSDALIVGMGGGTLLKQFNRIGFNVEAVELDKRIREVGYDYFFVDRAFPIAIDDGRHYLNIQKKKFDVIAFDVFLGETPPSHLFTTESFQKVKEILKPDGLFIINFYGYITGDKGKPNRSVLKTLKQTGLQTLTIATPSEDESHRNIFFISYNKKPDFSKAKYTEPGAPAVQLQKLVIPEESIDLNDATVLTDDLNPLEIEYLEAASEWRKEMNKSYASLWVKEGIKVFK